MGRSIYCFDFKGMDERFGEYIIELSVSARAVLESNAGVEGMTVEFLGQASTPFYIPVVR